LNSKSKLLEQAKVSKFFTRMGSDLSKVVDEFEAATRYIQEQNKWLQQVLLDRQRSGNEGVQQPMPINNSNDFSNVHTGDVYNNGNNGGNNGYGNGNGYGYGYGFGRPPFPGNGYGYGYGGVDGKGSLLDYYNGGDWRGPQIPQIPRPEMDREFDVDLVTDDNGEIPVGMGSGNGPTMPTAQAYSSEDYEEMVARGHELFNQRIEFPRVPSQNGWTISSAGVLIGVAALVMVIATVSAVTWACFAEKERRRRRRR
jgi:hypothetical protein